MRPMALATAAFAAAALSAATAFAARPEQGIGARVVVLDAATGDLISVRFRNPNDSFGVGPCVFID